MEFLNSIVQNTGAFLETHTALSYVVLFFGSYFETLIGVGFFIYGEMFFIPGALLAGAGVLNIWLVALALLMGGMLGDSTSFAIGRRYGASFFKEHHRVFNHTNYEKGMEFFRKYGTKGIFFSRLLGPVSWVTPFLAGVYKIPYPTFLPYNIAGVTVGIGQFLVVGYFFGSSYQYILSVMREYAAIAGVLIAVLFVAYLGIKRGRTRAG